MSSRSAQMAAAARAAHLEVDRPPFLFEDTMARRPLGEQAEELLSYHHKSGSHPVLLGTRLAVTTRARFAEDRLAAAVSSGVSQYVILGAGLDSFVVRSTLGPGLAIFEVDEPPTSAWKGDVLRAVEIVGQPLLEQWVDSALWNGTDELRPSLLWAMAHVRVPH